MSISRSRKALGVTVLCAVIAVGSAGAWWARRQMQSDPVGPAGVVDPEELLIEAVDSPQPAEPVTIGEHDWPWWRGPNRDNHTEGVLPPLEWSDTDNVLWDVELPGSGHSSPVIIGDQILLTTATEDEPSQSVLCIDRNNGDLLWNREVHRGELMYCNPKNSHASPTLACDGMRVFAVFLKDDSLWMTAVSLSGEQEWQTRLGPIGNREGFGASPVIHGSLVIQAGDSQGPCWITAVHRETGEIAWRTPRPGSCSYASAALITVDDTPQLVLAGLTRVDAYSPATGTVLWTLEGPGNSASTPAFGDGRLYYTGCTPEDGIGAITPGNQDTPPAALWNHRIKCEVPSPLFSDGLVYFVQDNGVMLCVEADGGDIVWRKRLGGNCAASPVLNGDRILVSMEDGRVLVLAAGRSYEVLAENQITGELFASPVISNGRLYLRTRSRLLCVGERSDG